MFGFDIDSVRGLDGDSRAFPTHRRRVGLPGHRVQDLGQQRPRAQGGIRCQGRRGDRVRRISTGDTPLTTNYTVANFDAPAGAHPNTRWIFRTPMGNPVISRRTQYCGYYASGLHSSTSRPSVAIQDAQMPGHRAAFADTVRCTSDSVMPTLMIEPGEASGGVDEGLRRHNAIPATLGYTPGHYEDGTMGGGATYYSARANIGTTRMNTNTVIFETDESRRRPHRGRRRGRSRRHRVGRAARGPTDQLRRGQQSAGAQPARSRGFWTRAVEQPARTSAVATEDADDDAQTAARQHRPL